VVFKSRNIHEIRETYFVHTATPGLQEVIDALALEHPNRARLGIDLGGIEYNQVVGFGDVGGKGEAQRAGIKLGCVGKVVVILQITHGMYAGTFVCKQRVANAEYKSVCHAVPRDAVCDCFPDSLHGSSPE
jgi:hypothetical protein